jgi:hypothetical protein
MTGSFDAADRYRECALSLSAYEQRLVSIVGSLYNGVIA